MGPHPLAYHPAATPRHRLRPAGLRL